MSQLFTIGYEGTDIDRFVATLNAVGIDVLADVRAVPISRKRGFSKTGLRNRLESEGIAYRHLVDLGDPKEGREAARAGRIDRFRTIYSQHLRSPVAQAGMQVLAKLAAEQSTCLMCFERDPSHCHRSMIAARLGQTIVHLFADRPSRYLHAAELSGRHPGQGAPAA